MSFLFKSSKKGSTPAHALPPASRDIRSSDGPNGQSQIPTFNGSMGGSSKPGSPTPQQQQQQASVNNSLNSVAGNDMGRSNSAPPQEELARQQYMRAQQDGASARGSGPPSPEQKSLRGIDPQHHNSQRLPMQNPRSTPPDPSPYPWSQRRLTFTVSHTNPFPRYGAAVNATGSKDGSVYLMGGLINGSTVKGDLWMVEAGAPNAAQGAGQMTCYPVATTSEGPGPRVGHASLLVGNAFIVFGGDTKMDDGDQLDDTLYLLNTSTKQWSRALPAGPRPPGRYGHTLNILGSKIYIFGGQVEGYFFNDLVAFDLNALQQAANRWEILIQNTIDGGPPHGQIPPARTNHTMISYNDKLYLFGGTDGVHWYNDVWSYSPHTNSWTQLECIGYIPSPREGHSAALVGDVMYIFGGRTEEGNDLGDLAAFRITSRRWYTFQNMGPSPSPRSGHSMTTVGKQVVVLAGEPSSAPRDPVELGLAYFLDTAKIRYPPDSASQTPVNERVQGTRRPSGDKSGAPIGSAMRSLSQQAHNAPPPQTQPAELADRPRVGSGDSYNKTREGLNGGPVGSKLPRISGPGFSGNGPPVQASSPAPSPAPTGPPPQAPGQQAPRTNGVANTRQPTRPLDRALSPVNDADRALRFETNNSLMSPQGGRSSPAVRTPAETRLPTSPGFAQEQSSYYDAEPVEQPKRNKPETYQPSQDQSAEGLGRTMSKGQRSVKSDMDRIIDSDTPRQSVDTPASEQLPKVREMPEEEPERPQDSGLGSSPALSQQYDDLSKELESVKAKNAWFASELALARKSGYSGRPSADSPVLDERAPADLFQEEDKPLIEALLKMRAELAKVQETIDQQARDAAERIAEVEKQRNTAVNEAVFARARLAGSSSQADGARGTPDQERQIDLQRKLASSLNAQSELSRRVDAMVKEVEAEKRARRVAEETVEAAQKRVAELESHRQAHTSELESLRSELHETQSEHRELSASHSEMASQHKMLSVDKDELSDQLESLRVENQNHTGILSSMREAVTASTQKAELMERKLQDERAGRDELEQRLKQLKAEHEERTVDLDATQRRLQDAEELAERHAQEARTHREAVLAGLGKVTERDVGGPAAADERVAILQQRAEEAGAMVRQNQAAADAASQKLRSAEERIAGLEAYQEQASREGLAIRKQLQSVMKEKQSVESEKNDLEQRFQGQLLEANALHVQHSSLKDILAERGINAADVRRSRALDSPSSLGNRFSTPDLHRVRELEQQLDASLKSHDDMKSQFEEVSERDEKMKREYEEKLTALDNDHQAAVKYLRGTEKMLSKMKQELQRVKNENGEVKKKLEKAKDEGTHTPDAEAMREWEQERERLRAEVEEAQAGLKTSVADLEGRIETMQGQLRSSEGELENTKAAHATSHADLAALRTSHSQSRGDLERLQKENGVLEERARDAENKVQLLLDQVEHSVDNYRRQSRMGEGATPTMNGNSGFHHQRNLSGASQATTNHIGGLGSVGGGGGHSRNVSDSGQSAYSIDAPISEAGAGGDGRNSMALDTLATELDALRSHWETTNKSHYRHSNQFDFEQGGLPSSGGDLSGRVSAEQQQYGNGVGGGAGGGAGGSLADWRRGLDIEEDEDEGDESRPTTSHSTVKGEDEEAARSPREMQAQAQGQAVTTPGGMA